MSAESAYVDRTQKNESLSMACAVGVRRIQEVANLDESQHGEKFSTIRASRKDNLSRMHYIPKKKRGKAHRLPYTESKCIAKKPLKLVHSDVVVDQDLKARFISE